MPLADEIGELSDRIQKNLDAVHHYYFHTKTVWLLVQQLAAEGRRVQFPNTHTGTVLDLADVAELAHGYMNQDLPELVFSRITSLLEDWVFGLLRLWLLAYPKGIPHKETRPVPLADILEAPDKESIIQGVVEKILDDLARTRPAAWFDYLNGRVKLDCPTSDQVAQLAEINASRDLLIHNRGIVNEKYTEKAGDKARYQVKEGVETRVEIREDYFEISWLLIRGVVKEMAARAIAKSTSSEAASSDRNVEAISE